MRTFDRNDINIHFEVPPLALPDDRVSIDSEFFGMEKRRLHRAHGRFAALGCTYDGVNVYMIFDEKKVAEFYEMIDPAIHVYQNAMFDIKQLRRYAPIPDRKRIWDTMVMEQIMYSGYYDTFALNDLVRRYCGFYLPKEERKSFSVDDEMDEDKIFYTACDIVSTWMVANEQRKVVDDTDMQIWSKIERPFMWTLLGMGGVKMDVDAWLTLATLNQTRADELRASFSFNPASPKQVKEALAKEGYKLESTNEAALEAIQEESELAKDVLEFRKKAKLASTYGVDFIEKYVEEGGRIYSAYKMIGAETGRTSSSNPNGQNIVHDKEYRDCFVAGEGNLYIIADWSSQEPRNLAFLSQDEKLIEILNSGKDLYIEVGFEIFGEHFGKKDKRRSEMKAIILGLSYGMSKYGLAVRLGSTEEYAEELIEKFFEKFPGVQEYLENQQHAKDHVTSILGRKIWLNHFTNQWYRNALNGPIQASAADAMKMAASKFCTEWGNNPIILLVHDEIVLEVAEEDAPEAAALLQKVMIDVAESMHTGITAMAEVFEGKTWGDKGKEKK